MKVRYPADDDFNQRIVTTTRRLDLNIDFQTAPAARLHHLSDIEVLQLAAEQGRILVTHDCRTMPAHFAEFVKTTTSPGLIIVSKRLRIVQVVE
jgi:predicted nuclease of predicted toxin-antitoxin system